MIPATTITKQNLPFDPFAGPPIERVVLMTPSQAEIWSSCQIGGINANRAFNESVSLLMKGKLELGMLERALRALVQRHEALRAVFSSDGRLMTIFEHLFLSLAQRDITDLNRTAAAQAISDFLKETAETEFDLVRGPLFKATLIKISDNEHQLILTAHHIICDGWSFGIMLQELGALYTAYLTQQQPILPKVDSYSSYADHQHAFAQSEAFDASETYWVNQYQNSIPQLELPADFERPKLRTFKSQRLDFEMNPSLLAGLKTTGAKAGCSLVTSLLAAFEVFLYTITGQRELVVGLPAAGQSYLNMPNLVGHCVNILPLRSSLASEATFSDYLKERKTSLFDAYDHQNLSFGQLLQKLKVARDPSRVPLVPVVLNIDLGLSEGISFMGLQCELKSNARDYETFEIFLNASGTEKNLVFEWSFNTALFKPERISQMMADFENVIQELVAHPDQIISENATALPNFPSDYALLNATETNYTHESVTTLLQQTVSANPKRTALDFNGTEFTYADLQRRVDGYAEYLIKNGVERGQIVGVCLTRTPELVISLLAILQCGAAYLPLDTAYPDARLQFMIDDSGANYLLTQRSNSTRFKNIKQIIFSEDVLTAVNTDLSNQTNSLETDNKDIVKSTFNTVTQDHLAYVMYTSGSTGKPKGVPVTHGNLVNFLISMAESPGITQSDRLLAITSISFDIAGLELYLPLLNGATIVLADHESTRDGRLLAEKIKTDGISILQATPTTWQMLIDTGWSDKLPIKALCGGEVLSKTLAEQLTARCQSLWNMYGPTETTVWSAIKEVTAGDKHITIGRPIANTKIFIVDENFALAKPGTIGEICIAGDGLTDGYLKRPELSAEKFIEVAFEGQFNGKLYRTGDLGKLLPCAELLCLGRIDTQVKIRGHRIELGEIEQALLSLPKVKSAAVVIQHEQLSAFIIPESSITKQKQQTTIWRNALHKILPSHLIPKTYHLVSAFPVTLSGKLDRMALAKNENSPKMPEVVKEATTTSEKIVIDIWKNSLGLDAIDRHANFFELGGHSLTAVSVMSKIEAQTGKKLPLSSLFEYSTVASFAKIIEAKESLKIWKALVPIKPHGSKPPLYMIHGAGLNVLRFNDLVMNLDPEQPVYGLQGIGQNGGDLPLDTVEAMAAHYIEAIVATNPNGPYALAGYSLGGIIAYEMARQLVAGGKQVKMIGLLDTYIEPYYFKSTALGKQWAKAKFYLHWALFDYKIIFGDRQYFKHRLAGKINRIRTSLGVKNEEDAMAVNAQRTYSPKMRNTIDNALNKYEFTPSALKVELFRASQQTYYMHEPEKLGWTGIALKGVNVHNIPGNHSSIFSLPNAITTANILQEVLNGEGA